MLKEYNSLEAAIPALGESPPKLWFFTMALPHNLIIDNLSTAYKHASTKRQLKYIISLFRRLFSKYFPKAVIVPELTKEDPKCVHLHMICTSLFESVVQYRDWYDDLYLDRPTIRVYDPKRIAFQLKEVYDLEGLDHDYLLKDHDFFKKVYYMEYTGKPYKLKFNKMVKKCESSKPLDEMLSALDFKSCVTIDFDAGFE